MKFLIFWNSGILKFRNSEILKFWILKFWNFEIRNSEFWNFEIRNSEFWNSTISVLKNDANMNFMTNRLLNDTTRCLRDSHLKIGSKNPLNFLYQNANLTHYKTH